MAEDLKKLVEKGVSRGYSLEKIQSDFANAGWGEAYLNNIPVYYNELKKKSPVGPKDAGVLPSRQGDTRFSSESQLQQDKYAGVGNVPLSDPLLKKKDGLADSLFKILNQAQKDADNTNKYVPQIEKIWNDYSSIERGPKSVQKFFTETGNIDNAALEALKTSSKRNSQRAQEEAKAIAKDDGVFETFVKSTAAGLLGVADYFSSLYQKSMGIIPFETNVPTSFGETSKALSDRAKKAQYGRKLLEGFTEEEINDGFGRQFAKGNYSKALSLAGSDFVELLPQVGLGLVPVIGLPTMISSAGGGAWEDVRYDDKYSMAEKMVYAPLIASAEFFTEKFFGMDRRMAQDFLSKAFGKTVKSASEVPKKDIGDLLFKNVPKALRAPLEEGLEEGIVSTFQQTLDNIMAGKSFDPYEIAESAILGAGAGGSTYALVRGGSALLQTPVFNDVYTITNNVNKINELLKSEDIVPEEKEILSNRLNQFKTQLNQLRNEASDYYKPFSQEDKQRTLELNQAITKGMKTYGAMKTPEAKAEVVNTIRQSLAEKAQIEQKYDSTQKQQVPSPVVQGAQPGGVPIQGTSAEAPQAGGVLQVPSQQEEEIASNTKVIENSSPAFSFKPVSVTLTENNAPEVIGNITTYVDTIPDELFKTLSTSRQEVMNGVESISNVISSLSKSGRQVPVTVYATEDAWKRGTGQPLSRGIYVESEVEGQPSSISVFLPALVGNTVYHEGLHDVVPKVFGTKGIETVAKRLSQAVKQDPLLAAQLGQFVSNYEQSDKAEEFLAELGSRVSAGDIDIEVTKSLATRFMEAVASVLGAVGIKMSPNASQLSRAFLEYAQKLGAGVELGEIPEIFDTEELNEMANGDIESEPFIETEIVAPTNVKRQDIVFPESGTYPVSKITKSDVKDIEAFLKEQVKLGKNFAFWYADQFGRGNYVDPYTGEEYFLDGGPSFPFDPENKKNGDVWATGYKTPMALYKEFVTGKKGKKRPDFIVQISGHPRRMMFFNKTVNKIWIERARAKYKDVDLLKKELTSISNIKGISFFVKNTTSWEQMLSDLDSNESVVIDGKTKTKSDVIKKAIGFVKEINPKPLGKKGEIATSTKLYNLLVENGLHPDNFDDLRDGFFKEYDFNEGEILCIYKATDIVPNANTHGTYAHSIKGEPVLVPDAKVSAWGLMPEEVRRKRKTKTDKETGEKILGKELQDLPKSAIQKAMAPDYPTVYSITKDEKQIGRAAKKLKVKFQLPLLEKGSSTTQRVGTTGSYTKAANIAKSLGAKNILDYGAGFGLGSDAMRNVIPDVESLEPFPQKWRGKTAPTYTDNTDIKKKYDAVVSLNVLNVVRKDMRDAIVKDIFSLLNDNGAAIISTRKFKGDIDTAKNFEIGPEEKSYLVKVNQDGKVIDVFQKGFDGNELVDYLQELLGDEAIVRKDNSYGAAGAIITKSPKAKRMALTDTFKEATAKALEGVDITTSNDDLFNKIKGSKWNTIPYTLEQIVKKWDELKNVKNDNIDTIKYLIDNPSKTPIVLNSKGDLIDGHHRVVANKISGISKVKYVFDDGSFDINEPFTGNINKNISEAYYKAKADGSNPKLVQDIEDLLGQTAPKVKRQVTAWHGSPYDFETFKSDKIGTGEGLQAFGWGLYFTDLESIARDYAKKLSGDVYSYDGKLISKEANDYLFLADDSFGENFNENTIRDIAKVAINKIKKEYIPDLKEITKTSPSEKQRSEMPNEVKKLEGIIKELENIISSKEIKLGKNKILYKVSLHKGKTPDQYTWLEWDKPLTKGNREKILNQLEKEGFKNSGLYYYFENLSDEMLLKGEFVYGKMAEIGGLLPMMINNEMVKSVDEKQASLFLLRAGIDGVKYPAGSIVRFATSDNDRGFNYVVFDENAATIESKIKFQKIAKAQGSQLEAQMYAYLLSISQKQPDNTYKLPFTLDDFLSYMVPTFSKQRATEIYENVSKGVTPEKVVKSVPNIDDAYEASKKLLDSQKNKKMFTWDAARKFFLDRQATLKAAILKAGMKNAYNLLVNRAGSGARANYFFSKQEKAIYDGLSSKDIEALDKIIMLRRIAEIDRNFDARGESRPIHPSRLNFESAQLGLAEKRKELGSAKFNELNDRADKYFDAFKSLLDSMYDEGLVSEDLYNRLKNLDYQPRMFLEHVFDMDELSMRDINLSANQVKRIKDGSGDEIMFDSRFLLAVYSKSTFSRIARNKVNRAIAEATSVNGNEEWISKDPKKQFSEVTYFEDGVRKQFYIKSSLKGELDDVQRFGAIPPESQKYVGLLSGSYLLKLLATRANPLFVFRNIPRDYLHVLFFTNVYDNMNMPLAMYRLAGDAIKGVKGKIKDDQDYKDFIEYGGGMEYLSTEGKEGMMTNRSLLNRTIEKLGSAGELSEIAFRLGMYKRLVQESLKNFDGTPTEEQLAQIKVEAVTKSREMIDFAQGGVATKTLESAVPYINAAFQGFRVSSAYIKNNPKEFVIKLGQLAIGLAVIAMYNAVMGDDDMEDIPEDVKRKYFIIMTPFTEEKDGKTVRKYIKIAKTQQLIPFISSLDMSLEGNLIAPFMGREPRFNEDTIKQSWDAFLSYFPKDPTKPLDEALSSVPLFSALAAYKMNYDTYRKRIVSTDYQDKNVLPAYEDFSDKNVPYFYKAIGQAVDAGPKRLQVATEKFITTPYSSLITMGGYTLMDAIASNVYEVKGPGGYTPAEQEAISNKALKSAGINVEKIFIGTTDPDHKIYNKREQIERINLEASTERRGLKLQAKELGGKYFTAKEQGDAKGMNEALEAIKNARIEVRNKAAEEKNKQDYDYFNDALKTNMRFGPTFPQEYNDITFATDNEARAKIIAIRDMNMTQKELIDYLVDYKRKTGKSIDIRTIIREYDKFVTNEKK